MVHIMSTIEDKKAGAVKHVIATKKNRSSINLLQEELDRKSAMSVPGQRMRCVMR